MKHYNAISVIQECDKTHPAFFSVSKLLWQQEYRAETAQASQEESRPESHHACKWWRDICIYRTELFSLLMHSKLILQSFVCNLEILFQANAQWNALKTCFSHPVF